MLDWLDVHAGTGAWIAIAVLLHYRFSARLIEGRLKREYYLVKRREIDHALMNEMHDRARRR